MKDVAVLDYGSGNLRSVVRALERVGANVTLTSDSKTAESAAGLVVPGVGAFAACMSGLRKVGGERIIARRLSGSRPVLGICVGMQIMFESGVEHGIETEGCGEWPGTVTQLDAQILPHMGWNTVQPAEDSQMFADISDERFYFVHSYAAHELNIDAQKPFRAPLLTWAEHESDRFLAAVENGPLWATQFHPEKSGDAGAHLLKNWLEQI